MREPCIIAAPYQGALNMSFCVFSCFHKARKADINASSHIALQARILDIT